MSERSDWKENIRQKAKELIQSAKDVVKHHNKAEQILNDAADDLDLAYRNVFISSISGYVGMAGGGALAAAGGLLTVFGVTAIIGVPMMVAGGGIAAAGVAVRVGAAIGDFVERRVALKKANDWVKENAELCKTLIDKHNNFDQYLKLKGGEFGISEKEILMKVFGSSIADELIVKLNNVSNTVQEWKTALIDDAGKLAVALLVATTPLVVGGIFIVADVALLIRTAHKEYKQEGGTKLAVKLREGAKSLKQETHSLRSFSEIIII